MGDFLTKNTSTPLTISLPRSIMNIYEGVYGMAKDKILVFSALDKGECRNLYHYLKSNFGLSVYSGLLSSKEISAEDKLAYRLALTFGSVYAVKNQMRDVLWVDFGGNVRDNLNDVAWLADERMKSGEVLSIDDIVNLETLAKERDELDM